MNFERDFSLVIFNWLNIIRFCWFLQVEIDIFIILFFIPPNLIWYSNKKFSITLYAELITHTTVIHV